MIDLAKMPNKLPVPMDDGASDHLVGLKLPDISLPSTGGRTINVSTLKNFIVIYCYPMTGRPNVPLPSGWDEIPGARGCTPQSCSFRDHYKDIQSLGSEVVGLSTQTSDYQKEMVDRLHIPFPVLSDSKLEFKLTLSLPTFEAAGMTLLKRLTIIAKGGLIVGVRYPVFPSDSDPVWVMNFLKNIK
jgi:peroxiredoxin